VYIFRVLENRVLKRIFGLKTQEVKEAGENKMMGKFMTYVLHQILLGQ
jgi:hypothetical protein